MNKSPDDNFEIEDMGFLYKNAIELLGTSNIL